MTKLLFSAIACMSLSGCSTIETMNELVNESTCSIHANRYAVERSTEAVRRNAEIVKASNETIAENHRLLKTLGH